jgi:NTP pyrophosphatase (non-canonical NTP hydrolase)
MHIKEFQQLMKDLYFSNDSKRGIHRTTLWLVEETGELVREIKKNPENYDQKAISEELADICAWVASISNILGLDLESALAEKYPGKCRKCGRNPCECNQFL